MAHLLRGKQAGIQTDLSVGLSPATFIIHEITRYGINSQISQIAYDPVQSLLAVGTKDTKFGPGRIYVFGQKRISVTLPLPRRASVRVLQFCADKLVCLDSKNEISVFSLETKKLVSAYSPPGTVTAIATDPTLDYALLGLQNGDILAYDLDREAVAPFKIPNFWVQQDPRARVAPIVTLAFHPRDIGTLLIGYTEGALIYSFKQNKPVKFFNYHLPKGALGGDGDPASASLARNPRLTQALWHPTGTFILTGHEDSSIVIWDPKDGRTIMARTLTETNVDKPGLGPAIATTTSTGAVSIKDPLFKITWCANQDPDDTGLLIAGGASTTTPIKGLTFFELGRTPNYATSTWEILSAHFESPKRQRILPTPPNAEVVDFCTIPRSSPHFAGAQDPIAVLALLSSGEVISLSMPSGFPISPTNQLHISMTFVHPFITKVDMASVERSRWLGMTEARQQGPLILKGGAEAPHPLKRYERRAIVQTAHADGSILLWDAGHGDEIENESLIQADLARAVGRMEDVHMTRMSFAGATGELAAGLRSGEVVVFRWSRNKSAGREPSPPGLNKPKALTNVTERRDPALSEGLLPFTLLNQEDGPVTALRVSDVGFVAAGFEGGNIAVIDLRGPTIIYQADVGDFVKHEKRGSFRRASGSTDIRPEWATIAEFSVMTVEGDDYSSILLHIGTNLGHIATFKLLPESSGRYAVQFAGAASLDDRIISISPLNAETGHAAYASQSAVANLRSGFRVNGVLLAVTQSGVRLFKPATGKGAHKTWDGAFCDTAAVARYEDLGYALLGLFGDGAVRAYSIPALKELGMARVDHIFDVKRFGDAMISPSGDILSWTSPSEMALINVWGTGKAPSASNDTLFNPNALIPPRPTISNLQWLSGTQYITPSDMDILIGGPERPPSKRMLTQQRADALQRRSDARTAHHAGVASSSSSSVGGQGGPAGGQDEGYWAYMQRQINERTEKLGIMGDGMERLQDNSSRWAEDASNFVSRQKRNFVVGAVKSKFGL